MPGPSAVRVLLINPPSPERLGAPLLGQQYVASAALAAGAEVRVVDMAARHASFSIDDVIAQADGFEPHIVGVALFTRWVWHAYALVDALAGRYPLCIAGGAHVTARPEEPLAHGFDVSVVGEAEHAMARIVDAVARQAPLDDIPGLVLKTDDGRFVHTPAATVVDDLDSLPSPLGAQSLYDASWYDVGGARPVPPGGLLTSRGCPAKCTFCANYVTGRRFRFHSAERVVHELNTTHERFGTRFFPFWDDALTANRKRLRLLCDAIQRDVDFQVSWSAITRADLVTEELLQRMKDAGLIMVNFGVESGDDDVLVQIGKNVRTEKVVRALEMAKATGLRTAANFMLGFPEDTLASTRRTIDFIERIAPLTDTFSTLGVLIPFPNTPLYELHHERYGFTNWWLDERYAQMVEMPSLDDKEAWHRWYIDDATLELDFFHYRDEMKDLMREGLRKKAEHNLRMMGWSASTATPPPSTTAAPTAGEPKEWHEAPS